MVVKAAGLFGVDSPLTSRPKHHDLLPDRTRPVTGQPADCDCGPGPTAGGAWGGHRLQRSSAVRSNLRTLRRGLEFGDGMVGRGDSAFGHKAVLARARPKMTLPEHSWQIVLLGCPDRLV